jgi:hypothetical protein
LFNNQGKLRLPFICCDPVTICICIRYIQIWPGFTITTNQPEELAAVPPGEVAPQPFSWWLFMETERKEVF